MYRVSPLCGWPVPYFYKSSSHTGGRERVLTCVGELMLEQFLAPREQFPYCYREGLLSR